MAKPPKRRLPLLAPREEDRNLRPSYAVWEITLACDLACRHCGSRAGRARPEELTTAECLDVVDQLADLGVLEVTLIGGEAYLRDDWLEIVRAIRARGMQATMTTGGRGITRELAERAAAAGLQRVSVSIDGDERSHDALRGARGSYRAALAALDHLREAGIRTAVNTQINRMTWPHLASLLEVIIAKGARAWQLAITAPMGRAAEEPELLLQPEDFLDLFPDLAALKRRCDEAKVIFWPANNIGYFGPYEHVFRGASRKGHMSSCTAGRKSIGIEADGTVKGCPSLPTAQWAAGNVRDAPLRDIWLGGEPLRYTRVRTVDDLWGYCRDCYYAEACLAGCTWTSQVLLGRPGNNPYCHHRALERRRAGLRERLVPAEPAPNEPFDHGRFDIVLEEIGT
ncbi:MAG TPA: radical SAM protein [Sandaracinaceae bacterium]